MTAFIRQMRLMYGDDGIESDIIFPFKNIPYNHPDAYKKTSYKAYDYTVKKASNNPTTFGAPRNPGNRLHAARDLYFSDKEPIYSMANGIVKSVSKYYRQTKQITIEHDYEIVKGSKIVARYGEVINVTVNQGDEVKKGQKIAEVGLLVPHVIQPAGEKRGMLHLEIYSGEEKTEISPGVVDVSTMKYTDDFSSSTRSFKRRIDLIDPLELLNELYSDYLKGIDRNFNISDAEKSLKLIHNEYGKEMATIIEKMYRVETAHFKSTQFKKTGTGGMESHGVGPYFGWSKEFFDLYPELIPLGVFAIKEGKGAGGNKQDTVNKKRFVIMTSVYAGMKYKAYYIKKHNMDYARWYSTNEDNKKIYRESLKGVKARIVEKIK